MVETSQLIEIRDTLIDIAQEAGDLVVEGRDRSAGTGTRSTKKGKTDLVTEFDLAAERLITERLQQRIPDVPIMSEELASDLGAAHRHSRLFVVDPIDGTTNYAHGHPIFGISLAYVERETVEGRIRLCPRVGVVGAPVLGRIYAAVEGRGATQNGQPIRTSGTAELGDALAATGFPYNKWDSDDDNVTEFKAFLKRVQGVRRCGAASLDLCFVAEGTYDFYWERKLKPWDVAAGAVIVAEGGGRLSDELGGPLDLLSDAIVASNGRLHDAVIDVLRPLRRARVSG